MLYILASLLPSLEWMKSIYLRGFLGFGISYLMVIFIGKPFINYLKVKKFGESIREEGPESHFSKKGTPTMGGILIIGSLLITTILVGDLTNKFIIALLINTVLFAGIGFIDDYKKFTESKKGLSGRKKILGQCVIGTITWIFIKSFGLTGDTHIDYAIVNPIFPHNYLYIGSFFLLIFIILILTATSNAVNITDGLDGLAIMPVIIAASILGLIAYFTGNTIYSEYLKIDYIEGAGEITVFLTTLAGGGLGFLWYNFYPAQIFMGDTGSLTLGGILGLVTIFIKQEMLLPVIGLVFVVEALSVILQVGSYKTRGKRIFKMAPIHHHFELEGLPETKVTMRFWIIALICGIAALGIVRLKGLL